jgi:hypothetical protein
LATSWIVFNAFLHKCPPEKRGQLVGCLSEKQRKNIGESNAINGNPTQGIQPMEITLDQIHYTWFAPYLRTLGMREIPLFLAALSEAQATGLKKALLFSGAMPSLRKMAKKFLRTTLFQEVTSDQTDLLPLECLPKSPLNVLLDLGIGDLNTLIDYLGLHDLAVEVKQIIETAKLKKIYNALSQEEQNYLKILLQSREPVAFSRMGLANWKGDAESLKTLLRQRGINRLAKALYGQNPSLIWYLAHKMDTDRAILLQKLCAPLENAAATKLLISQILELLSYTAKEGKL